MLTLDLETLGSEIRLRAVDQARKVLPVTPLRLDAIARMAAKLLGTPMAAVTLVGWDEDQFLGMYGMPEPFATMRSVPLEYSLCAYVVSADEPVAVGDMLADDDLWNHPAAVEYGIRAFAGVPLRDAANQLVAAVTVFDVEPRSWTPAAHAALGHIAEMLDRIPVEEDAREAVVAALAPGRDGSTAAALTVAGGGPVVPISPAAEAEVRRGFITALLDSLQVGVVAFDNDRRLVLFNRTLRRLYGLPDDTPIAQAFADACRQLHHVDGTPVRPDELVVARALRGETVRDAEGVLYDPRLPNRWLLTNGQPIRGADGGQLGAVSTVLDVTERRRAEQFRDCELAVARRLNACTTIDQAAPDVVQRVGETLGWIQVTLWLHDDVADLLRPTATWNAAGAPAADRFRRPIGDDDHNPVTRAWQGGEPVWQLGTSTGYGEVPVRGLLAVPVHTADAVRGVLVCLSADGAPDLAPVLGLLTGVTGQLGHFLDRLSTVELGLQLDRAKDDFLGLVGHEMRTPLTSIVSYGTLLAEEPLTDDVRQMVTAINRNAETMQLIIGDLLELAGLESGHLPVDRRPVDLCEVATAAVAAARSRAAVPVRTELPARVMVDADPLRLRQIFDELISNAIKYSADRAEVDLGVRIPEEGVVEIVVADRGIGVPVAERPALFTRFFRASNARHSTVAGTGLGLVLVQTLVHALGGTVALDPEHQPGTRIVVRLPCCHTPDDPHSGPVAIG
ncbi:ATP-binding protein [Actinoplanes sp. NPDC049599]|uniref:sensor histidine kinase n=1 Tax=Actinoplanes sp. NPDC049599 TaxID=3363903 RepID=UPI00379B16D3